MNYDKPGDRIKRLIKKNGLSQKELLKNSMKNMVIPILKQLSLNM